jgi:hypothetical protein
MKRLLIIAGLLIIFTFTWAVGLNGGEQYGKSTTFNAPKTPAYALNFDGNGDYVSLPAGLYNGNITTAITIEYWFKGTDIQSAVRFQNGGDFVIAGWGNPPQFIVSTDGDTGGGVFINGTGDNVEDGNWHHIACVRSRNGIMATYVDGELSHSRQASEDEMPLIDAIGYLGALNGVDEFTTGQLQEVRIWNVARTAIEIQQNMNKELTGNEPGLVAYYKMSNGSGSTLSDNKTSGTTYDGTISNATWVSESTAPLGTPATQTSNITFNTVSGTSLKGAWTNGTGSKRLVFAKTGSSGTAEPQNATTYTANATFGSGTQIGSTGWYCVYNGTGNEFTVSGLTKNTSYIFQVFEYNGYSGSEQYLTSSASNNPNTLSTNSSDNSNPNFALNFDGNDKVDLPTNLFSTSNFTSALTIEYWFKGSNLHSPVRFQDSHYIVPGYIDGENIISLISFDSDTNPIICTRGEVNDNQWHHIAVTWKQNTVNGYNTYFDGVLRNSKDAVNFVLPAISAGWLGALINSEFITGQLEEVRIWNVERSAEQIQQNKNKELNGDESGLVAYYKMSNGSGPTLSDDKTNGTKYDGSITGAAWTLVNPESLTLPVELSAFTANYTASNTVSIIWITQSETNMIGYHILRADENNFANAHRISDQLIQAVNFSTEHSYSYTDQTIMQNTEYYYWLQSAEMDGTIKYFGPIRIKTGETQITPPVIPFTTQLKRAYPNPFNPSTMICFDVAQQERVIIEVFNAKGQKIKTLFDQIANPGSHQVLWDGTDSNSRKSSSGIYFYRMTAGKYTETHKMLMMK